MPADRFRRKLDAKAAGESGPTPVDTVRRIPLPGGSIVLVGLDHAGVPRKAVVVASPDATLDETSDLLDWVRKWYPKDVKEQR